VIIVRSLYDGALINLVFSAFRFKHARL